MWIDIEKKNVMWIKKNEKKWKILKFVYENKKFLILLQLRFLNEKIFFLYKN